MGLLKQQGNKGKKISGTKIFIGKRLFLKKIKLVPPALVAVIVSILLNEFFIISGSSFSIKREHLVNLPVPNSIEEFKSIFILPNFSALANTKVWVIGVTIAVVASIETLLCVEAADRMDVQKRFTDTNVELKAQGIGNIISSLLGGLPMTSVVVRTTANNTAGAKSKLSTIIHGLLLTICAVSIPSILFLIGAIGMPLICYLSAFKKAIRNLFFIPSLSIIGGILILLWILYTH